MEAKKFPCVPALRLRMLLRWQRTLPVAFRVEEHHHIPPACAKRQQVSSAFEQPRPFIILIPVNLFYLLSDLVEAEKEITSQGPQGKAWASYS